MDWSKPDQYWIIFLSTLGLLIVSIFSNTVIALISQAVVGRYEWNGDWLKL